MLRFLYILDKIANKLLFGKEWETISSRMGKCLQRPKCKGKFISIPICNLLNLVDKNHCIDAIETEYNERGYIMMRSMGLYDRKNQRRI